MEKYLELTKNLISEFDKSSSDYFEIHISDFALTLKKGSSGKKTPVYADDAPTISLKEPKADKVRADEYREENDEKTDIKADVKEIKSPIVGVFYEAKDPKSEPFVKVGQKIKKGDVLCILESMKMMNEIRSDYSGIIKEIKCKNEELVEYGQVMFVLEDEA